VALRKAWLFFVLSRFSNSPVEPPPPPPPPPEVFVVRMVRPHGARNPVDAIYIRAILADRRNRARYFDAELFGDPAWDILLDLTAAAVEGRNVSIMSLCIAANVSATSALRHIKVLQNRGLVERVADPLDQRRAFISISVASFEQMMQFFERSLLLFERSSFRSFAARAASSP